jgi:chitin synthase
LEATLHGVAENIRILTRLGWEWASMVVVIVVDGLETMSPSMVDYLHGVLKLLEPSLLSRELKGETVHLHVFERTVELTKHSQAREYYDPMQVTLALSTDQCGDMKSHMWLFNAFCQQMQPTFVFAFAAGVVPHRKACLRMLDAFDANARAAIVIPETHVPSSSIFHPLIMSQLFLTKFMNSTVTPFHSLFGFTPTAGPVCAATGTKHCIALRWPAIPSEALGTFFKCQEVPIVEAGPLAANRSVASYLATSVAPSLVLCRFPMVLCVC